MKNKKKSLSFLSSFLLTFLLIVNVAMPAQALTPRSIAKSVSKVTAKVVKVSASVNNKTPKQYSTVYVTVNGTAKASVAIVCHYKTTKSTYRATIGSNGKAILPVRISRATKGYKVVVNVSVTYKGKTSSTTTPFTPR